MYNPCAPEQTVEKAGMKNILLFIEPNGRLARAYTKSFGDEPFKVMGFKKLAECLNLIKSDFPVVGVVLDVSVVVEMGSEVVQQLKGRKSDLVLIVAGHVPTDSLIECTKFGIDAVIEDPIQNLELLSNSIKHHVNNRNVELTDAIKKELNHISYEANRLVGQSEPVLLLKKQIHKIAPLDSTVLITGETGTGKEVVARMIHSLSPQRHKNFIAVHCGGIPDTLLESTLFGHEKGSFTGAYKTHRGYFEIADGGTIFLDEIGDTTPSFQVKLLRVLQDREFRRVGGTESLHSTARVLAATNRNLRKMVEEINFREDLYYRLNVISLKIPPLRERPEDIPLLIRHFMNIFTKKHKHVGRYLKPETVDILKNQSWKGNVRELENVIERMVALSDSDWIGPSELPDEYLQSHRYEITNTMPLLPYAEAKNLFECEYIAKLLKKTHGNVSRAAKLASMPRQNLHLKIKKHNLKLKAKTKTGAVAPKDVDPVTVPD